MRLQDIYPSEIVESSWFDTYKQNIDAIWHQLGRLNSNIYILEKIYSFPFDLLWLSTSNFWNLVNNALFESCIMIIWRAAMDNSYAESLTIQQLKNEISRHINDSYRDQFREELRGLNFESTVESVKSKIVEIRHNYIAHYNFEKDVNPTTEDIERRKILFSELKKYLNTLTSFFDLLCFGHQRALLPLDYHPDVINPIGVDSRSDIEQLLDLIAKNSDLLNLPEQNPNMWDIERKNISQEGLNILNTYRIKFGLSNLE